MNDTLINQKYLADDVLSEIREGYAKHGYAVLDQFFKPAVFTEILRNFESLKQQKKRFDYFCESDSSFRKLSTINGNVILNDAPYLRSIYENPELRRWVESVTGVAILDCHESLWAIFNIHEGSNCDHGWHADKEAVVFNLMIDENIHQIRQGGGLRLYSNWLELKAQNPQMSKVELYNLVESEHLYEEVYMTPGQAVLFKGTSVLHKVTSMPEVHNKRVTFLYSWDDIESSQLNESEASLVLYK